MVMPPSTSCVGSWRLPWKWRARFVDEVSTSLPIPSG